MYALKSLPGCLTVNSWSDILKTPGETLDHSISSGMIGMLADVLTDEAKWLIQMMGNISEGRVVRELESRHCEIVDARHHLDVTGSRCSLELFGNKKRTPLP